MIKIKVSFDYVIDHEKLEKIDPDNPFLESIKENREEVVNRAVNELKNSIEEEFDYGVFEGVKNLRVYEDKKRDTL